MRLKPRQKLAVLIVLAGAVFLYTHHEPRPAATFPFLEAR